MPRKPTIHARPVDPVRAAAVDMSIFEMRKLLKLYYKWQPIAQTAGAQLTDLQKHYPDNKVFKFIVQDIRGIRTHVSQFADIWVENHPAAKYFKDNVKGAGPIICATLACYIDIDRCKNHYSSLWKFAGFIPGSRRLYDGEAWAIVNEAKAHFLDKHGDTPHMDHARYILKKLNRPYGKNTKKFLAKGPTWKRLFSIASCPQYCVTLHLACLSLGNTIIKHKSLYQDLFRYRVAYETAKNENGDYASIAKQQLDRFNFNPEKVAYKAYIQGKLPAGHIVNRARRWSVKIMLTHYYQIEYYIRHGKAPPDVYALDVLKGNTKIHIPGNWKKYVKEVRKVKKEG